MSKNELHALANATTPDDVAVPGTWPALIAWMLGKFGIGIGVACVFGWFTIRIYADLQSQNTRILDAFQQQTLTNSEHIHAIRELAVSIESLQRRSPASE